MTDPDRNADHGPDRKPKPPMSDARMSGMVATAVLLAIFVFVGWFVWLAS